MSSDCGSGIVVSPSSPVLVGLTNGGATCRHTEGTHRGAEQQMRCECSNHHTLTDTQMLSLVDCVVCLGYLNSLLQSLFMTRDFRRLIFSFEPPPIQPNSESSKRSVPYQLQLLFARMAITAHRTCVDTADLTYSFGWSAADSFRQHDVQELMRLLLNHIEKAPVWGPQAAAIYTGELTDSIECTACHAQRRRRDPFQDIALSVSGYSDLPSSLRAFLKAELMDGDNKLRCDSNECHGAKQPALKSLDLAFLPPILTFQLKRFLFSFELMSRVKVNDTFEFPHKIDMAEFIKQQQTSQTVGSTEYELFAILIHSGVAMGGHYYAFLQSLYDGGWYEFNDSRVTPIVGGLPEAMKLARGSDVGAKGGTSAYMLMYRRVDAATPIIGVKDDISESVRAIIDAEEKQYAADAARAEQERRTLHFTVHCHALPTFQLQLDLALPVTHLAQQILTHYEFASHRMDDVRLRKYDAALDWSSDIYTVDDRTLEDAKFAKQNQIRLELKQPSQEWTPYAPESDGNEGRRARVLSLRANFSSVHC